MPYDSGIGAIHHKKHRIDKKDKSGLHYFSKYARKLYRQTVNDNLSNAARNTNYEYINGKDNPTRKVSYVLEFLIEDTIF